MEESIDGLSIMSYCVCSQDLMYFFNFPVVVNSVQCHCISCSTMSIAQASLCEGGFGLWVWHSHCPEFIFLVYVVLQIYLLLTTQLC